MDQPAEFLTPASYDVQCLRQGRHYDPFTLLGCHPHPQGGWLLRCWLPGAVRVRLEQGPELRRVGDSALFSVWLSGADRARLPRHYALLWQDGCGQDRRSLCPYSFAPQIGDLDLHLFGEGRHWQLYNVLGARWCNIEGVEGVQFAVWAPSAERVSVVGNFNGWNGLCHPMRSRGGSGVWELFIPGLDDGERYKYEIRNLHSGHCFMKADPYARSMEMRPRTASIVHRSRFPWQDGDWLARRADFDWQHQPLNIYEAHLGSWQRSDDGRFLNYRELARRLVDYVRWMEFTHINLLPLSEHPLDESWGYQTSAYYAPTRRYGDPDDFRYFVDYCHQHDIGVFLDWVPAHFPKDSFALARFDGTALYEHEDPRLGEHQDWGTYIFNFGRNEVRNFLLANALYWMREFHVDGLRVDAVASMLYLDYSRAPGQWLPNRYGGNENLEAIEFLKQLNTEVHAQYPGVVMMAEESTSWPMVSRPIWMGGLGFSMKWNMGWMNDTLSYFEKDPIHRRYHHNQLTFSQLYAYSENFILPLSHDEVVHLKRSLLDKMPGDLWQKYANLRLLLAWQMLHPGKKLLFMGGEFGQWAEWDCRRALDWQLCDVPAHRGVQLLQRDLNQLYATEPALYRHDFDHQGFCWLDCNDYEQSVLAFIRQDHDQQLLCIFNFTPVVRHDYRLGAPRRGVYRERLNSDAAFYGGSNLGMGGQVTAEPTPWQHWPASLRLTLPPLAVVVLRFEETY
ncbi:1,4-alpha-glucan branching protein GlgB [Desulfuromonas thiophila]|uniref:1,4-alpha-glucan branching protein GlgB n=1 Tax=Desulfuromonas thiophila TaxID=57664 RepID=UPI0029F49900|nr:1,4-alpha-glucan branching protein GlgB [Desulfuromonas thiophila]